MGASARFVVVGGGVVAASVAYHLARRGASVIIVEGGQRGAATSAGAGIICPWTAPLDDACYRLCAEGAAYYLELLAMLAEDGEADSRYARVGALCVAGQAQALQPMAALLASRRTSAAGIGEVAALAPGEPARMFPPLAPGLAGLWIGGGARVDGRAIRDCLLCAAVARGARRVPGTAVLDRAAGRVTGVTVGADRIGADAVVVAAGAWTAGICAQLGIRVPVGPQRGQIVHARLPRTDTAAWRSCGLTRTRIWSPSPPGGSWPARPGSRLVSPTTPPWAGSAACWPALPGWHRVCARPSCWKPALASAPSLATGAPCSARSPAV